MWDLGALGDIIANRDTFQQLREEGYIRYDDRALVTQTGRRVDVEFVSNAYRVEGQQVIQCNIRDMTEAKRAAAAVQMSENFTREIINALPIRVFWKDTNLTYRGCNVAFARDAGFDQPHDVIGRTDHQMGWRAEAAAYQADDRQVLESGRPRLLFEEPQTTPSGETITLLTSKVPLRDATGAVSGILGTYMDVTPLKRAERAEALLAMAVQQAGETIEITDRHGIIIDVNPAFETTSGYSREEAIGRKPNLVRSGAHDAEFYRRMWEELSNGRIWRGRLTNRRKDGTLYEEDATISPVRDVTGATVNFVAVKRDVTEQEQLAAQLRRAQRLESIGTLAGGIAHDLNNALAPILMATELMRPMVPAAATEDLGLIETGARRGAALVKQLLNFAKGAEGNRLPVQLRPLLDEVERLIHGTFPKNITLQLECPLELPAILGDATQLHQVLLNLCLNARDAMPDGGTLAIEARVVEVRATEETDGVQCRPRAVRRAPGHRHR